MNINQKNILLYAELVLLLGPLTLALCYTSLMSLFVGIPSLLISAFDSITKINNFMLLAVIGNLLGVFSIVVLWGLVKATLKGLEFDFSKRFQLAIVAGAFASIIIILLLKLMGFLFVVLPIAIVTFHSIYLQNNLKKHNKAFKNKDLPKQGF